MFTSLFGADMFFCCFLYIFGGAQVYDVRKLLLYSGKKLVSGIVPRRPTSSCQLALRFSYFAGKYTFSTASDLRLSIISCTTFAICILFHWRWRRTKETLAWNRTGDFSHFLFRLASSLSRLSPGWFYFSLHFFYFFRYFNLVHSFISQGFLNFNK